MNGDKPNPWRLAMLAACAISLVSAQAQNPAAPQVPGVQGRAAVLAPVRDVMDRLGFRTIWDPATDGVCVMGEVGALHLRVGEKAVRFRPTSGLAKDTALPQAPRHVGPRIYAPVEVLVAALGLSCKTFKTDVALILEVSGRQIMITFLTPDEKTLVDAANGSVVRLQTSRGSIYLELFDDTTPVTVGSFLDLVDSGFYDSLTFHRVIADFMIQGGDPQGDGCGGPGFTIPDEADRGLKHERGSLSMAKTAAPNSGGSQFFICHLPQQHLDGVHTVFGKTLAGMQTVDAIQQGDAIVSAVVLKWSEKAEAAIEAAKRARVMTR